MEPPVRQVCGKGSQRTAQVWAPQARFVDAADLAKVVDPGKCGIFLKDPRRIRQNTSWVCARRCRN